MGTRFQLLRRYTIFTRTFNFVLDFGFSFECYGQEGERVRGQEWSRRVEKELRVRDNGWFEGRDDERTWQRGRQDSKWQGPGPGRGRTCYSRSKGGPKQ